MRPMPSIVHKQKHHMDRFEDVIGPNYHAAFTR
jgi:hypothetical protein